MLTLETYPEVLQRLACERRDKAQAARAGGADLSEQRKADRAATMAQAETERLIAESKPLPGTFEQCRP